MSDFISGFAYRPYLPLIPYDIQLGYECEECEGAGQIKLEGQWMTKSQRVLSTTTAYFQCPCCKGEGVTKEGLDKIKGAVECLNQKS